MTALRTVRCPNCGAENMLGKACPCAGKGKAAGGRSKAPAFPPFLGFLLTFLLTAAAIIGGALAFADAGKPGYGIALAVGAWLLATLWRLGHDWDDGIDVRQLIFPAPLDWPVKFERFINFWTDERPYFRAIYLACWVSFIVVMIVVGLPMRRHP